jgi:hypothetical protein
MDFGNRTDPTMTQLVPGLDPDMPNSEFEQPFRGGGQTIYDPAEMSNFGDLWHKMYPNAPTGGADRNILTPQERQRMGIPDANGYQTIGYTPDYPYGGDDSLPPPANMVPEPSLAPDLEPRFGGHGSYPISNPAPNETMYPNDMGFFPQDYPPDFNNQSFPDTVYNPAPNDFMAPPANDIYRDYPSNPNPAPNEFMAPPTNDVYQDYPSNPNPAPNETMYPTGTSGYYDPTGNSYDFSGSPVNAFSPPDIFANGPADPGAGFQWPFFIDQFSTPGGVPDTGGGGGGNVSPDAYSDPNTYAPSPGNPQTINPNDPNNNLTRGGQSMPLYPTANDVFPQPSMMDELGRPTDWRGAGQFVKDAAGNIRDAAGRIVQAAGEAATGIFNNIMNDPGYSSPGYLQSIGYRPGQGTGSMWPGGSEGYGSDNPFSPEFSLTPGPMQGGFIGGVGGQGGTLAGGGTVGNMLTAIGFGGNLGGGGPVNPSALGGIRGPANQALTYLHRMYKGLYTTPQNFGLFKHAMPSPWASQPLGSPLNPGWNWNTYHGGQVDFHNQLVNTPGLYQSIIDRLTSGSGEKGANVGGGPPQKLSRHTPELKPA